MFLFPVVLLLVLATSFYWRRNFAFWLNPVTAFLTPWLLVFGLLLIDVYRINPFSFRLMILFLVAFLTYLVGVEIFLNTGRIQLVNTGFADFLDFNKQRIQVAIVVLAVISTLANTMILLNLIAEEGSILRIIAKAALVRDKLVRGELNILSYYGYFSALSLTGVLFSGLYAGRYGSFRFYSLVSFIPVLMFAFIYMGRANLIWALLLFFNAYALVFFLTGKQLFTRKRVFFTLVLLVILLFLVNIVNFFRGGGEILLHYEKYLVVEEPDNTALRLLYSNYIYVVGAVPGLDRFLDRQKSPLVLGGKSFRPLAVYAEKEHLSLYYPFVKIPMSVNVYSILADAYMDFGWPGFFVVPFFISIVAMALYKNALEKPGALSVSLLAITYTYLQFSIFYSILAYGTVWIAIFGLFVVNMFLKREEG